MSDTLGTIAIPGFDPTYRNPGVYAGIDSSGANTARTRQRTLLLGQMNQAGTATPNKALIVGSPADVAGAAGQASLLFQMAVRQFKRDPGAEVWIAPMVDAPGSTAATGGFTFVGTATSSGTIAMYLGGVRYAVGVSTGDTAATIAANFDAAANLAGAPFGTSLAGAEFSMTFLHGGLIGNDLDIGYNYGGATAYEVLPQGITITVTPMSGGTLNPPLTDVLDNLGTRTFDFVICPYTDTISLDAMQELLAARWSPLEMLYGHCFAAYRGNYGQSDTFLNTRNDPHTSVLPFDGSPDPVWIWAVDYGATCAQSLRVNPNLPLQYLLMSTTAPPDIDQFTPAEMNSLLFDGGSTFKVNDAAQVILQRSVTTYQTNVAGAPDDSYLDTETDFSLMDLIRDWQIQMLSQFAQKILVIDGSILPGGSAQVTSQTVRASTIGWYNRACAEGRAQDPAGFAAALVAQNAGGGQVRETLPLRLANQLRQILAVANFTKP